MDPEQLVVGNYYTGYGAPMKFKGKQFIQGILMYVFNNGNDAPDLCLVDECIIKYVTPVNFVVADENTI